MNFLSLISPTSILAGIVIALSLSNALFIKLYSGAKDELVTVQAQISMEQAQIEADVQRRLRLSDQVNAETRTSLDTALAALRKRPAVRVLPCSNGNTGTGATLSAPAGVTLETPIADAADTGIILTAEACAEKLGDGIEDAVRLSWLQHWIVSQHEAQK